MTRTRWTLRDWEGGTLDHRSLYRLVAGLGPGSAFYKARNGCDVRTAAWLDGSAACSMIADLIDAVRESAVGLAYRGTGKKPPRLDPYPRPWAKDTRSSHYGRGAVPVGEFDEWYYGGE